MKQPKKPLVLVCWDDAQFDQRGEWQGPASTFSVGYQLKNVKDCIRLAQSWSSNQGYAEVLTIPVGMVRWEQELGPLEGESDDEFVDVISDPVMTAMQDSLRPFPEGPGRIGG